MKLVLALLTFSAAAAGVAPGFTRMDAPASGSRHPLPLFALEHVPRTVWDSVYSDSQATRGQSLYSKVCSRCHQDALTGQDDAPPLAGKPFFDGWNNKSLGALNERISSSMPSDDPGSLSKQDVADVISYILRFNSFPAGSTELPPQPDVLKDITIVSVKP